MDQLNQKPIDLIRQYFADLKYPAIKEVKPCLLEWHGKVYLVSFENEKIENERNPPNSVDSIGAPVDMTECSNPGVSQKEGVPIPNCYAIMIGDKVAGYHEDFLTDADKYRLVLKQHLGMLAMEAKAKEPAVEPKPQQESRDGHCKNDTVDAIVTRYEEMLVKAQAESEYAAQESMAREAELSKQLIDAQAELIAANAKLELIRQTLEGKPSESTEDKPSPVASMITQDNVGPYDADRGATLVGAAEYQGPGQIDGDYTAINQEFIPYKDHNAAWPRQTVQPYGFRAESNGNIRRVQVLAPVAPNL